MLITRRSSREVIKALQRSLVARGFDLGKIDGIMGRRTEAAILAFQRANGLAADGLVGPKTLKAINSGTAEGASRLPRSRPEQPGAIPGSFPPVSRPEMTLAQFNRAQAQQSGVNLNKPQSRPPSGPAFPSKAATGNTLRPERRLSSNADIADALRRTYAPEVNRPSLGDRKGGSALERAWNAISLPPNDPRRNPALAQSQGMSALRSMPEAPQEFTGTYSPPEATSRVPRARPEYQPSAAFPGNEPGDIQYSSPISGTIAGNRGNAFGDRRSLGTRYHAGVDWNAPNESSAHAVVGGTVVYAGHHKGYQNMVDVLGDDGNIQRYATHGPVSVKAGDKIKTGDTVGTIDRKHLHFEIIPPGSPAFEKATGGRFGQTSWRPLRDPQTLDPAKFFGIERGGSYTAGQPLNVAAMNARRENRMHAAQLGRPLTAPVSRTQLPTDPRAAMFFGNVPAATPTAAYNPLSSARMNLPATTAQVMPHQRQMPYKAPSPMASVDPSVLANQYRQYGAGRQWAPVAMTTGAPIQPTPVRTTPVTFASQKPSIDQWLGTSPSPSPGPPPPPIYNALGGANTGLPSPITPPVIAAPQAPVMMSAAPGVAPAPTIATAPAAPGPSLWGNIKQGAKDVGYAMAKPAISTWLASGPTQLAAIASQARGPAGFWDQMNRVPGGPTDIARASFQAAKMFGPGQPRNQQGQFTSYSGGSRSGNYGGGYSGNYNGGSRYQGPGSGGYTNRSGGA